MNGPWTDYQETEAPASTGPWTEYEPARATAEPQAPLEISWQGLPEKATLPEALAAPTPQGLQPWQGGVVRSVLPGALQPEQLVPAIRLIGGEVVPGEKGDTHPDIIKRERIPAVEIDQRGFEGPGGLFFDRESAAQGTQLPTQREPGRLHSTDLMAEAQLPEAMRQGPVDISAEGVQQQVQAAQAAEGAPLIQLPKAPPVGEEGLTWREQVWTLPARILGGEEAAKVHAQVGRSLYNAAGSISEFFSTDEGALSLLAGLHPAGRPLVAGYFGYEMAQSVLEQAKRIHKDWDTMTPVQKADALTQIAATGIMSLGLAKHTFTATEAARASGFGLRPPPPPSVKGAPDAIREREVQRDIQTQRERNDPLGLPAEAGPSRSVSTGPEVRGEVAKEGQARVLLSAEDQAYLDSERKALDNPDQVVIGSENLPEGEPFAPNTIATINRATKKVVFNPTIYARWVNRMRSWGMSPERIRKAIRSVISEEQIHLATTEEMARKWMENASNLEWALETKLYTGHWTVDAFEKAGGRRLDDIDIGFEAVRRRMQKLNRVTTTEVAELVGRERWGVKSLEIMLDIVQGIREKLGRKASVEQLAILDRLRANTEAGILALGGKAPAAPDRKETLTPAIRLPDGTIFRGTSHGEAFIKVARETGSPERMAEADQPQNKGFVDQSGKFLTRSEAVPVFKKLTGKEPAIKDAVQSEDLRGFENLMEVPGKPGAAPASLYREAKDIATMSEPEFHDWIMRVKQAGIFGNEFVERVAASVTPEDRVKMEATRDRLNQELTNLMAGATKESLSAIWPQFQTKQLMRQTLNEFLRYAPEKAKPAEAARAEVEPDEVQRARQFITEYDAGARSSREYRAYRAAQDTVARYEEARRPSAVMREERPPTLAQVRQLWNRTKLVTIKDASRILGGEVPEYLNGVMEFMGRQREKVTAGKLTPRDVAKAYAHTLTSIGAGAIRLDTFYRATKLTPGPEFTFTKGGIAYIRPEEATAYWLLTPEGRRALDSVEKGTVDLAEWEPLLRMRDVWGRNDLRNTGFDPFTNKLNFYQLGELTRRLNEAKGDSGKIGEIARDMAGIGPGKEGFLKHLLGFGDTPTVDSVELNFWLTGKGDIRHLESKSADVARQVKEFSTKPSFQRDVTRRIQQQVKRLAGQYGLPPEAAAHIVHHWLWDKAKETETTHAGMMRAQEAAARYRPRPGEPEMFLPEVPRGTVAEREGFQLPKIGAVNALADAHFADTTQAPSLERFRGELQSRFGAGVTREAAYYAWQDAMNKRLMQASGAEVDTLIDQLGLRGKLQDEHQMSFAPGTIPDPVDITRMRQRELTEVMQQLPAKKKLTPALVRQYFGPKLRKRYTAIGAIVQKLTEEAGAKPDKPWSRAEIGPEDVNQIMGERQWYTLSPEEAKNPEVIGRLLTTGAAVHAEGKAAPPRSVTRGLLGVRDDSGRITLTSGWRDPRRGPVVTDPANPSAPSLKVNADLLKRYRPFVVIQLRDPVQKFTQHFADQAEFDRYFGDIGIEGTEGITTSSFVGPEAGAVRAQAGIPSARAPLPAKAGRLPVPADLPLRAAEQAKLEQRVAAVPSPEPPPRPPIVPEPERRISAEEAPIPSPGEMRPTMTYETLPRPTAPRPITEYGKPEALQPGTRYRMSIDPERAKRAPGAVFRGPEAEPDSRSEAFERLAALQRNRPEEAMKQVQRNYVGGILNYMVEHVGDLIHRVSQHGDLNRDRGYEASKIKIERAIRRLTQPYGFVREFNEDIKANAPYAKMSEQEFRNRLSESLKQYADEHRQLPAYNNVQRLAQQAAIAIGEQQWGRALDALDKLNKFSRNEWITEASKFEPAPRTPGAILRGTPVADEYEAVKRNLQKIVESWPLTQRIPVMADNASNRAHIIAQQAENRVRLASVSKPGTRLGRAFKPWMKGNREVLGAANALVEAKAVRLDGSIDNARRGQLVLFRQLVNQGMQKARAMVRSPNWHERRIGRAWVRNQENLGRELDYAEAHWNDPDLQQTAARMSEGYRDQINLERSMGYDVSVKPGYDPHRYDAALWNGDSYLFQVTNYQKKILGIRFREPQLFPSYYHASAAGPYLAVTRDGASLVNHRIRKGQNLILQNAWREALLSLRMPDGRPVAIEPVAGAARKYLSPKADYEVVLEANHLAVHNDYARLVKQLTSASHVEMHGFSRALLHLAQTLKHSLLVGDFFHLGRMIYYGTSIMGRRAGFKSGWSVLDIAERDMPEAVSKGIIRQQDMNWALTPVRFGRGTITRRQLVQKFYSQMGANLGRVQDALYKDLLTETSPTAGPIRIATARMIDPSIGRYNRFLFDRLTRGMMAEAAVRSFEKQMAALPNASPHTLMRDIARDVNNFFGNIGRQGWFKSKTWQDISRMLFLAPQWVEGLVKKEAIAYSRLSGLSSMVGARRGVTTLGVTGAAIGRGMIFMLALTQALNLIFRKQPTWQNEPGHKWDAWIPGWGADSEGFWFSPLAIYNEITHDLWRLYVSKPTLAEAVSQIVSNKEQPVTRATLVAMTGIDPLGRKITTTAGRAVAVGKAALPIPITFGKLFQAAGHELAPGLISPPAPGAVPRQAVATLGIKIEPKESTISEVGKMAKRFMDREGLTKETGWQQIQTDEPGYSKLRAAIRAEDWKEAQRNLDALRRTRQDADILKSMKRWLRSGYTGARRTETMFWNSLTDEEMELYFKAQEQKQLQYEKFLDWYWQKAE